jgi:hypothetical protein
VLIGSFSVRDFNPLREFWRLLMASTLSLNPCDSLKFSLGVNDNFGDSAKFSSVQPGVLEIIPKFIMQGLLLSSGASKYSDCP